MEEDANETATRYHRAGFRVTSRPSTDSRRDPRHTRRIDLRAAGVGLMRLLLAPRPVWSRLLPATNAAFDRYMTISLAFLAPDLMKAAVEGRIRARWHTVFRRRAPPHLPRHLLFRILAYRLQADRLGELDNDSR